MRILALLLTALSLVEGAVTIKYVRTTGGTHAGTLAGLQTAVNECAAANQTDPCIVDVEAGVTYSNGTACYLTLPAQTNAVKLIVIRSSRIGELPDNVRVTPSDAAKLWKVDNGCTSTGSPILIPPDSSGDASHYVLQGCDAYYSGNGLLSYGTIGIGFTSAGVKARKYEDWPHSIIVDRCYVHGIDAATWTAASSVHANQNGIVANGRNITIKNSYIGDVNADFNDWGNAESHGIASDNGSALFAYNNRIDGSIGSLLGGGWVWITGMMMTYSEWYGNEYTRDPNTWHWQEYDATDTLKTDESCATGAFFQQYDGSLLKWKCVAGAWTSTTDTRPNRGWAKNGWECKNCRMAFVEGNYLHDIPSTGDQSQRGFCALINNVDAQDYAYHARPEQVQFRFNRCLRTGSGLVSSWGGSSLLWRHTNKITFEHNLLEAINHNTVNPTQGASGGLFTDSGAGRQFAATGVRRYLTARNNTFLYARAFGGTGFAINDSDAYGNTADIDLRDNILGWASVGQRGDNIGNEACSYFAGLLSGSRYWNNWGLIDNNSRTEGAFNTLYGGANCPSTIEYAASESAAGFVNAAASDYRLCTAEDVPHTDCTGASPFAAISSTGGPIGADAAQVRVLTDDAAAGTYDPSKYAVRIKRVSSNEIAYVAREPQGVCQISVTRNGSIVFNGNDGAGLGSLERTVDPELDTNGEHIVRVSCLNAAATESVWREARWVRAE